MFALQIVTRKAVTLQNAISFQVLYYQMAFPDWVTKGHIIQGRLIKHLMVKSWFLWQILIHNLLRVKRLQFC